MFGELVIAYLFLAGAGAGGAAAASLTDLFMVRETFGMYATADFAEKPSAQRLVAFVYAGSFLALALGATCLALDLGRFDRILALFLTPPTTLMNVGAWALALLLAVVAALVLVRILYVPWVNRTAVMAMEIAATGLGAVVAAYAGFLLGMLAGVRLWSTLWVPALFTLSAASCGCALLMAMGLFVRTDPAVTRVLLAAMRIDAAVIAVEAVAVVFFLAFVLGSEHPGVQASAESLLVGASALPWWAGFICCGLVVPLAVELTCFIRDRHYIDWASSAVAVALAGALVLVGGVGLRTAIVNAGDMRALELQEPVEEPDEDSEGASEDLSSPTEEPMRDREDMTTWLG